MRKQSVTASRRASVLGLAIGMLGSAGPVWAVQLPAGDAGAVAKANAGMAADDLRAQLKRELAGEIRQQIKAELAAEMRKQIRREMAAEMRAQVADELKAQLAAELRGQMFDEVKRMVLADLTGATAGGGPTVEAPAADAGKGKPKVVRVPYVPESMRKEIRDQVKREVLAQAKDERWGEPGALPGWLERFQFEGDLRVRSDSFRLSPNNTPAGVAGNVSGTGLTRGADLVGANGNVAAVANTNTQEDFSRLRLRARFGASMKVSDSVSGGFMLATGATVGPTSTNQTLGQNFNKYTVNLDRAYLSLRPTQELLLTGGRIANPFMATDLVWADDLNFEGIAASYGAKVATGLDVFATGGWFPLRTDNPLQSTPRTLVGAQVGAKWRATPTTSLRVAGALYDYRGMDGQLESNGRYGPPSAFDYGTRYEYPQGMRQRGNTLFVVNALPDPLTGTTYWGLASGFRELDLNASLDIARFDPLHVVLTGNYVRNLAFDRARIANVTGSTITDGKDKGYLAKILVGQPTITGKGDWNVSFAYRWLGSDAVLDAFTNSDFGLGGTNNKGYIFGASYGIGKNTWLSARWLSSNLIDSMAPAVSGVSAAPSKLSVDLLQVDINAKF